ncbi:MAG: hypothetical protein HYV29_04355 [Ignavibacteriales bacterium]|nr:hypothetical protein [Ignavibacteriales bacterium]
MRQYKLFILLIQVAIFSVRTNAGFERIAQPTALFARAFSGVAFSSESNVWLNPAALSNVSSFRSAVFYSPSPFQLPQLTNYGLLAADNFGVVKGGVSFSSFGFSLYKETFGSLSVAYTGMTNFSFGITVSLYHLSIESYGSALKLGIDIGSIYSLTEELNIGFALNNLNGATYEEDDDIPQIILAGLSYRIIEEAVVNVDLVKDIRYEPTYRAGIEFEPHDIVVVRSGFQGKPSRLFAGIGFTVTRFTIDYGVATHDDLGLTHSIGISFIP